MPTINQLPTIDTLQPDDLLPVYSTSNGDARKASVNTLAQLVAEQVDQFIANPSNATPQPATTLGAPGIDVDYSRADHSHPKTGVDSVSVASANGLAGTVAGPAATPQITLSTTVSGVLKGNGTAISAAVAGTDYSVPITTRDEGVNLTTATSSIDFTGTGVTATSVGGAVTVNIPGGGSVTSVSVASANGFAGTVANPTTTPAITMTTSVSGILKGNGTAISAATSGTDYSAGTSALATGILKTTTGTGALSVAVAADFPTLNQNTTGTAANVTGTVAVANGGTGLTATPTNGQIDIGNGTGFTRTTLTAGSNISITNGAGSITIAATGGGSFDPALTQSYGGASGDESVKILASGATGTNRYEFQGKAAGTSPLAIAAGGDTNISWDARSKGTGGLNFSQAAGGTTYLFRVLGISGTAANHLAITPTIAAGTPVLESAGTDANVGLIIRTQASGTLTLRTGANPGILISSNGDVQHGIGANTFVDADGNIRLRSYATGSLPAANTGKIVRDSTTNQIKFANGSVWTAAGGVWDLLGTVTPSGSSPTIDFLSSFNNTLYGDYELDIAGIAPVSAAVVQLRAAASGSAVSTSVYYSQVPGTSDTTSATAYDVTANSVIASGSATVGLSGKIRISFTGASQDFVPVTSDVVNQTGAAAVTTEVRGGGALASIGGGVTGVQLLSSVNFGAVGTVRLYGRRK